MYSFPMYVNYLSVHLFCTILYHFFPDVSPPYAQNPFYQKPDVSQALSSPNLDLILFPLDGMLRANSVTSGLNHLSTGKVDPLLSQSPFFHSFLGAVAASFGGLTAGTLGLWTSNWAFSTPPPFREGAGLLGTLDLWGGAFMGEFRKGIVVFG
jgi:hypothetical protein